MFSLVRMLRLQIKPAEVFKPYQRIALEIMATRKNGMSTRDVWAESNKALMDKDLPGETRSRACYITWLSYMEALGLMDFDEVTGKGGHRRLYSLTEGIKYVENQVAILLLEALKLALPYQTVIKV